jgi:hypothetical protein
MPIFHTSKRRIDHLGVPEKRIERSAAYRSSNAPLVVGQARVLRRL